MWRPHASALHKGALPSQIGHDYSQFDRLESYLVSAIARAELGDGDAYTRYVVRFSELAIEGAAPAMRGESEALAKNLEARVALLSAVCPPPD